MKDSFFRDSSGWTCKYQCRPKFSTEATYIRSGDTRKSHATLNLVELLALRYDIVHVLKKTRCDGSSVPCVGVKSLDDFLDGDWSVACPPGVKVGRGTDKRVTGRQ